MASSNLPYTAKVVLLKHSAPNVSRQRLQTETSMAALGKIESFLRQNAGDSYCDDCLSKFLNIRPRQQVQQNTGQLAKDNRFRQQSGICLRCQKMKTVI